jgi:uncharacterized membrane protein
MWYGHHGFPIFGIFFMLMFIGFIVRMIAFRRYGRCCHHGFQYEDEAFAILRRRLVNGEIGDEEYQRLKAVLKSK